MLLLNLEALFCTSAGIPCEPPPDIPNGKHTGRLLDEFYFGISVTYTCDPGYPLHGEPSIYCTTQDGKNGVWSGPLPWCGGRVACARANTRVQSSRPYCFAFGETGEPPEKGTPRPSACSGSTGTGCVGSGGRAEGRRPEDHPAASSIPSLTSHLGSLPQPLRSLDAGGASSTGKLCSDLCLERDCDPQRLRGGRALHAA